MRYLLFICPIILILGCKKPLGSDQEYRDLRFFVEQNTTTQITSFSGISLPINLPMFDIKFNLTDTGSINEPYIGMIDDIYLHSLKMELISPSNLDFGFIDDFEMFISSDQFPEVPFAHHYNASPDIGKVIYLVSDRSLLDDYIKGGNYTMRTEMVADEIILQDIEIEVTMVLDVHLANSP
jgi:hypothetical protein